MSSNEWRNTEYRNIRFVNKCSHDIYVGTEFSAGDDSEELIENCTNEKQDLDDLPYSALTQGEINNGNKCPHFRQIIKKISPGETQEKQLKLYKQLNNKCGSDKTEGVPDPVSEAQSYCRASVKMFPMIISEDSKNNVEKVVKTFIDASIGQGLTEFTFGADPIDNKGGDDNYDISAIIREGACSAHSNPYENDYGYANANDICLTDPRDGSFNNDVFYDTVQLSKTDIASENTNKQDNGCYNGNDKGCVQKVGETNVDVRTTSYYGCGMPKTYTSNDSRTKYTLKMESNNWELYPEGGGEKLENEERSNMLSEIRKEIVKCSYAQAKMNKTNHPEKVRDSESIFNFIPFELKALGLDGEIYNDCTNKTERLLCEPATSPDPSTLIDNCYRGYSYQYDDFVAGVTCKPPINTESGNPYPTYEITYCPENGSSDNNNCIGYWSKCNSQCKKTYHISRGASGNGTPCSHIDGEVMDCQYGEGDCPEPAPAPEPPGPEDRATCSTLFSCISGMEIDPLKATELCVGSRCDMAIDSDTCCKGIENDPSNASSNSQTEEGSGTGDTSNRASLSNNNTRFVSQIDDRPMYDGSTLEKNTSHTHIMQSSNYNPVGIDEGSGYSLLSNISSTVSGLGSKSKSIGLQPNNFYW